MLNRDGGIETDLTVVNIGENIFRSSFKTLKIYCILP